MADGGGRSPHRYGRCIEGCTAANNPHDRRHCCSARISISATIAQVRQRKLQVELLRCHVPAQSVDGYEKPGEVAAVGAASNELAAHNKEFLQRIVCAVGQEEFAELQKFRRELDFQARLIEVLSDNKRTRNYLLQYLQPPPED